jgi:hypothetical protein
LFRLIFLQVIPKYVPAPAGGDPYDTGAAINEAKSAGMDGTLQLLGIPASRIIRQGTRTLNKAVKSCMGVDIKAAAACSAVKGRNRKAQLLRRNAAEDFLQSSERCTASAGVLQQFKCHNADVRLDLSQILWLTVAALLEKALGLCKGSNKGSAAGKGKAKGKATGARKKPSSSKPSSSKPSSSKPSSSKKRSSEDLSSEGLSNDNISNGELSSGELSSEEPSSKKRSSKKSSSIKPEGARRCLLQLTGRRRQEAARLARRGSGRAMLRTCWA